MSEYTISSKFIRHRTSSTTIIYGLVCPITDEVFYVGKTNNPQQRIEAHLETNEYFQELAKHDTEYTLRMVVLEAVSAGVNPDLRETYWILHMLEKGIKLHNKTYPMRVPETWVKWLTQICEKHGWNARLTSRNRLKFLPDYSGGAS